MTPIISSTAHECEQSTILQEASAVDADLVVVGNRGFSPVKSTLLGSVSRAVLRHVTVPVLVAPEAAQCPERATMRRFSSAQL